MSIQSSQIRSMYRRLLRELPMRQPSILANPSAIQQHIRADLSHASQNESAADSHRPIDHRIAEAEQFLQYLKAQRTYTTLLERYNPGMSMNDEDKIRMTARRVGMDLPVDYKKD